MKRKALVDFSTKNPHLLKLLPYIKGNVVLIFFKEDIEYVKQVVLGYSVLRPAISGDIAPSDVIIPHGISWLPPSCTPFFATLDILTTITRGTIEILYDAQILRKGQKIQASHETLLRKLEIKPFVYRAKLGVVFIDGFIFNSSYTEPSHIMNCFRIGVQNIASLCLAIEYPTVPFSITRM